MMTRMTRWLDSHDSHDSLARWLAVCQDPLYLLTQGQQSEPIIATKPGVSGKGIMGSMLLGTTLFYALLAVPSFGKPLENPWIELSYPFNNETIYWPGSTPFKHTTIFANFTDAGFYLASYDISAAEHGGTHIDSPMHFSKGAWAIDQIPLDHLIGPAVKVDISSKAEKDPDAQVMVSDLEAWEQEHGKIPDGSILLMFSGWGKYWPDKKKYLGTDTNDTSLLHFPGFHPNTSRWLVENRKIKLVGVDTPSVDYGQSKEYLSHRILYRENIPGLENVAHMEKLPAKGATLYAAPMFIEGGSGAPCRIFARLENNEFAVSTCVRMKMEAIIFGMIFVATFAFF